MSSETFVEKMKSIQNSFLEFLEEESDDEDKYDNFINLVSTQQIINDKHEFKALLQLINSIWNNHHRVGNYISKFERVLRHFKQDLQKNFSNSEIFDIFKDNKRILLFLLEEKLMTIDEYIFPIITSLSYAEIYCGYFQPEIKRFLTQENIEKYEIVKQLITDKFIERMNKEIESNFYEKRREGENDDYLCELIRFNKTKELIAFVERTNLPLENEIKKSIFETNNFLTDIYKFTISLLEYASFYGSNDIIKYMERKGVELTSSMWIYAIHSCNAELIKYLEDNHVSPPEDDYEKVLEESIKCHHNEISNYIIDNLMNKEDLQNNIENKYYDNMYRYAVESYNYCFFPTNMKYKNMLFYLCKFDYYTLLKLYLAEGAIDINATINILIIQMTF